MRTTGCIGYPLQANTSYLGNRIFTSICEYQSLRMFGKLVHQDCAAVLNWIIIFSAALKPQTISRRVHTVDVALNLTKIVGANPPSGASGEVLLEVVGR